MEENAVVSRYVASAMLLNLTTYHHIFNLFSSFSFCARSLLFWREIASTRRDHERAQVVFDATRRDLTRLYVVEILSNRTVFNRAREHRRSSLLLFDFGRRSFDGPVGRSSIARSLARAFVLRGAHCCSI